MGHTRMTANPDAMPPGPRRRFPGSMMLELRHGPMDFMTRTARRFGDIASYRIAGYQFYLLSHPDHVREVLVTQSSKFVKGRGFERAKRFSGRDC